ncbi:GNAT family N-acetyltransferase [Rhizobium sp. BR 314]|uniref:GNAT family N-acetyltransferase n=1 Tax=Rhizobium sp. BR 314 TaxID=3040013 RepID=UPI0039BF6AFF
MALPSFETERLLLFPRTMADLRDCITMDRDPDVTRFIPGPWHDMDAHRTFVEGRIKANFGDGLGYWSVRARENPEQFLGWILLIPVDATGPDIEIGWRFNRVAWGKGYATEAATPVLAHAFQTLGLDRVIADIAPGNAASIRVAEKLGLSQPRHITYHDEAFASYSITRAAFEADTARQ